MLALWRAVPDSGISVLLLPHSGISVLLQIFVDRLRSKVWELHKALIFIFFLSYIDIAIM